MSVEWIANDDDLQGLTFFSNSNFAIFNDNIGLLIELKVNGNGTVELMFDL
jgi:hypothetical protein